MQQMEIYKLLKILKLNLDNAKINPFYSIKNNLKAIFNPAELPDRTSPTHAVLSEDGTKYVARPVKNENVVLTELTGVTIRQEKFSRKRT